MSSARKSTRNFGKKRSAPEPEPEPMQSREKRLTELTPDVVQKLKKIKVSAPYDYHYLPEALQGTRSHYHEMLVTCATAVVNSNQPRRTRSGKDYTAPRTTVERADATPADRRSCTGIDSTRGDPNVEIQQHEVDGLDTQAPIPVEDVEMVDEVAPTALQSVETSFNTTYHETPRSDGQGVDYDGDDSSLETLDGERPDIYTSVDGDSEYNADEESVSDVVKNILARTRGWKPPSPSESCGSTESDMKFHLHRNQEEKEKLVDNAVISEATHQVMDESRKHGREYLQPPPAWPEHCLGCHEDEESEFELRLRPVRWKPGSRPTRRNSGGGKGRQEAAAESFAEEAPIRKAPRFTPCTNKGLHDPAQFRSHPTRLSHNEPDFPPRYAASGAQPTRFSTTFQGSLHSSSGHDTLLDAELQSARDNAAQRPEEQPDIEDQVWNTASVGLSGMSGPSFQHGLVYLDRGRQGVGVIDVPEHDIPSDPRDCDLCPTQYMEDTRSFQPSQWPVAQASSRVLEVPHYHLARDLRDSNLPDTQMVNDAGSFEPFGGRRFTSQPGERTINATSDATGPTGGAQLPNTRHLLSRVTTKHSGEAQVKGEGLGREIIEVPAHIPFTHPEDKHLENTQVDISIHSANLDSDK